ncbi:MAG TPA: MucB/RseB C-terminal domain-containing protein [Gammaproteobacteria bacterium]|nr:MucB/RseB C-terminal domain-containing protein [Gammaproteobacteria bacterium]
MQSNRITFSSCSAVAPAKTAILSLLALLSVLSSLAQADDSAAYEWLGKMSRAAHELNYEGTFVYLHDKQLGSVRITHTVDARGEREHLVALNGAGREVIRDGSNVTCILPGSSAAIARTHSRKSFPGAVSDSIGELGKYYSFSLAGQERVAGRPSQRIIVRPKDSYRYGYHLSLDQETALLLKADMVNERQTPLEQVMFTTINLNPRSAAAQSGADDEAQQDAEGSENKPAMTTIQEREISIPITTDKEWKVNWLPEGFQIVEHNKYLMPRSNAPVEHMVFSDGLASVSVFIEKFDPGVKLEGASRKGAVNAYGTVIHEHQVTVMGEVPQNAVKLIGQAVRHEDGR